MNCPPETALHWSNPNNDMEANLELLAKWTQEELPPVDYKIIAGADSEWALDEEDPLSFRSDADYSKFVDVLVDDAVIAGSAITGRKKKNHN